MKPMRKLLPYLRPYRWHMLLVIVSAGIITGLNLLNPWLVRELVQIIRSESSGTETGDTAMSRVMTLATILVVAFVARAIFRYFYLYVAHIMAYSFVGDVRVIVYAHLQRLSARF